MTRHAPFVFLCYILSVFSHGQETPNLDPSPMPASPNVMQLEKFGNVPVSYHTGQPDISFPLYTLGYKDVQVPITLRYHAQGLKVNDINGYVGLGWAIQAGGHITQTINGAEDVNGSGGFASTDDITTALGSGTWEDLEQLYCQNSFYTNDGDNDVDIFSFSTPSTSGKFYFDKSNEVKFIPHSASEVELTWSDYLEYDSGGNGATLVVEDSTLYTITDPIGVKYEFITGDTELQTQLMIGGSFDECYLPQGVTRTHMLSKITGPGGFKVFFEYEDQTYQYLTDYSERDYEVGNALNYLKSNRWSATKVDAKRLKSIRTEDGYLATFSYTEHSTNTQPGPGLLTTVLIQHINENDTILVKRVDLEYQMYGTNGANAPFTSSDYYSGRHHLHAITETGKGRTVFGYDGTQLPPRFSYAQDYWGYYNGADLNTSLIPDQNLDGYRYENLQGGVGDRSPDLAHMKAGVLDKITYPTGGTTEFFFEANQRTLSNTDESGCVTQWVNKTDVTDLIGGSDCFNIQSISPKTISLPTGGVQNLQMYITSNFNDPDQDTIAPLDCANGLDENLNPIIWIKVLITDQAGQIIGSFFDVDAPQINISDHTGDITIEMEAAGIVPMAYNNQPEDGDEPVEIRLVLQWQEEETTCVEEGAAVTQMLGGLRLSTQIDSPGTNGNEYGSPLIRQYAYTGAVYELPKFNGKVNGWVSADCNDLPKDITYVSSHSVVPNKSLFGVGIAYDQVNEFIGAGEIDGGTPEEALGDCYVTVFDVLICPDGDEVIPPSGTTEYLGKVVRYYENEPDIVLFDPIYNYGVTIDRSHNRGILLQESTYGYDQENDRYYLLEDVENTYREQQLASIYGVKVEKLRPARECPLGGFGDPEYQYIDFERTVNWKYLTESHRTSFRYDPDNTSLPLGNRQEITTYQYNSDNLLPTVITSRLLPLSETPSSEMITIEYDTSVALGAIKYRSTARSENGSNLTEISRIDYSYMSISSLYPERYLLDSIHRSRSDNYPNKGDDLEVYAVSYKTSGGNTSHLIESVRNQKTEITNYFHYEPGLFDPAGVCTNCTYFNMESFEYHSGRVSSSEAKTGNYVFDGSTFTINGEPNALIRYWVKETGSANWEMVSDTMTSSAYTINNPGLLDNVIVYSPGGVPETFTHRPGWGLLDRTDVNGQTTYYRYDSEGRLIQILDNDKNIISQSDYHIVNH